MLKFTWTTLSTNDFLEVFQANLSCILQSDGLSKRYLYDIILIV